jgi:hypothetical protein
MGRAGADDMALVTLEKRLEVVGDHLIGVSGAYSSRCIGNAALKPLCDV